MIRLFSNSSKILVVAPHADDCELGLGGTIVRLKEEYPNIVIKVLVMTFSMGIYQKIDPDTGKYTSYSGEDRLEELYGSLNTLGITKDDVILGTIDDETVIPNSPSKYHHYLDVVPRAAIMKIIEDNVKSFNITDIFVTYPSYDQDHEACNKAVRAVMRPQFFSGSVYEYEVGGDGMGSDANGYVALDDKHIDLKSEAMSHYRTQLLGKYYMITPDNLRLRSSLRGREIYSKYAEAFRIVRSSND